MRKRLAVLALLALAGCDAIKLYTHLPKDKNVLFWTQDQRDIAFRQMEKLAKSNTIRAGGVAHAFGTGAPIKLPIDLDAYMKSQRNAGLIIIQDNKIRFEKYALDYSEKGRWTSFSVAKSLTSTLVGAALRDGYIKSLNDPVSLYIKDLRGSVYDQVTVEQLLTMTSGVKWNEDYEDPKSDVAQFSNWKAEPGVNQTVSYMRRLPREAPPGTKWVYKTGETNLIGVLVSSATGKTLSDYLSEKIWHPYGMEQDAIWILDPTGHEISGCCISAALRDYARFGQFMLDGAVAGGKHVVPDDWFKLATVKQASIDIPGRGYGFQWWTYDDGSYAAQGIFGQGIFIDPKRHLVIASNGDWPRAKDDQGVGEQRQRFYKTVQAAIDAEGAQPGR